MNISIENQIATLTFSNPERANSLDEAAWAAMKEAFETVDADPEVHVVILAGEGRHFCAGMDLSVLGGLQERMAPTVEETRAQLVAFILGIQDCITAIERCRKPVLAAIHGGCIGGGVDIVTACDMRYCTEDAYFTVKEIDFGIVADIGTLQRLPQILQPGLVAELAFTGRKMFGPEAHATGLVNRTFSDRDAMLEQVTELAGMIAAKPPKVIRGIKENLLYKRENGTNESLQFVAEYSAGLLLAL
ncbi:MAG: enoyl-CoA hydratase [Neolewinella sp.]|jgi:enoyl-CoA hydratase